MRLFYRLFEGFRPYRPILELQEELRRKVIEGDLTPGVLLLLEHTPVYTLGIRGKTENILLSEETLKEEGIEVVKIRRGGDVTYHGPGQLVVYPIFHMKRLGFKTIKDYTVWWGNLLAEVLRSYGIDANWRDDLPGVWGESGKIVAVGMHFKAFVPIHGYALNVAPNMRHFAGIVACGLKGYSVGSMKAEGVDSTPREVAIKILEILENKGFEVEKW